MHRNEPAAEQVDTSGRMEEGRELCQTVALPLGRDRGELLAEILGRAHRRHNAEPVSLNVLPASATKCHE